MTQPALQSQQISDPALRTVRTLRAVLLLIIITSLFGMAIELLFMDHFEDFWMLIPLVLIGLGLLSLIAHGIVRSKATVRAFQVSMFLMILGGALGMLLHHRAKEEFQLEGQPGLSGTKLFWEAMRGTTPPSLAPAALIQTGLLGLAWAYRHPCVINQPVISSISTSTGEAS